ncbi:MAG: DNA primase [Clostridiaceae bacterium]|nr:DNA primase [Clostridiaceae bacterium]
MLYPEEVIEEVRLRNDIVDVISSYIKLERKGKTYFGLCPFHSEKTPSFSVEPVKQFFYCFGCNKGGSVIQFIMDIENLEFPDALRFLADRAGITLPEPEEPKERENARQRKKILELNRQAARYFFSLLAGSSGLRALEYLKKRGLSDRIIRRFGLGLSPGGWSELTDYFINNGVSPELLIASGLSIKSAKGNLVDRFRNRIMFPIFDIRGDIIGFGGRVIDNSQPKYMNSPDTPVYNKSRELYGLNFARRSKSSKLLIVEGYMDVISLHQAGIDFAVASLGTSLTQMQAWILKKYADQVIISYDADAAGQAATLRGLEILEKAGCQPKVLIMPENMDPDDYVRKNGPEKFKKLIEGALSLLDYKIRVQKEVHSSDTIEDKLKLLNNIADILATHENSIERELYAKNYAEQYGISLESLRSEILKRMRRKQMSQQRRITPGSYVSHLPQIDNRYGELEYMLLVLLCNENRLYQVVSSKYGLESFKDRGARKAAERLYERLEKNKSCILAELLNDLDTSISSYLTQLAATKCNAEDNERAIKDVLTKLEILHLEDLQKETIEKIKNERDGIKRQELGLEFRKRAERIIELKEKT